MIVEMIAEMTDDEKEDLIHALFVEERVIGLEIVLIKGIIIEGLIEKDHLVEIQKDDRDHLERDRDHLVVNVEVLDPLNDPQNDLSDHLLLEKRKRENEIDLLPLKREAQDHLLLPKMVDHLLLKNSLGLLLQEKLLLLQEDHLHLEMESRCII